MSKKVDIWWDGSRLKASMRWTNKKGKISFYLIPASHAICSECPFKGNPICSKNRKKHKDRVGLCTLLWNFPGDNKFVGREKIMGWQPKGPLRRESKKE